MIAKLSSMENKGMTTLQRELLRFVLTIASFATLVALLMVILWAGWYAGLSLFYNYYLLIATQAQTVLSFIYQRTNTYN